MRWGHLGVGSPEDIPGYSWFIKTTLGKGTDKEETHTLTCTHSCEHGTSHCLFLEPLPRAESLLLWSSGWWTCPPSPRSRSSLCDLGDSIDPGLPGFAVSTMKGIGGRAFSWRKEFSFITCAGEEEDISWGPASSGRMRQGRVGVTHSVWLTRRPGSPAGRWWQGTVALPRRRT